MNVHGDENKEEEREEEKRGIFFYFYPCAFLKTFRFGTYWICEGMMGGGEKRKRVERKGTQVKMDQGERRFKTKILIIQ